MLATNVRGKGETSSSVRHRWHVIGTLEVGGIVSDRIGIPHLGHLVDTAFPPKSDFVGMWSRGPGSIMDLT
jgi:hypothetical protein